MNRAPVWILFFACIALLFAAAPSTLFAEDPQATLDNHQLTDTATGEGSQAAASNKSSAAAPTVEQMEKTVKSLEALVKQYEELIKKLEGQVREAEAGEEGTVVVNSSLNVRSGPWGSVIGGLTGGMKVRIIGKEDPWYKISYQGRTAYVHQNYVATAKQPAGQVPVVYPADYGGPIVEGTRAGGSTSSSSSSSNQPVPPTGDLQTRVVSAARALVGMRNFPYDPLTQGGTLGCAQVVSTALKNAGVMSRIVLNCHGVMNDLKGKGWQFVQVPPYRAGDVVTWKTYDSTGDGVKDEDTHIGIAVESGNNVQVMNNSSTQKMPRLCAANAMTLSHVLRKV